MRVGSVAALCMTADRALTQAWSRYFYAEPMYDDCDGVRFHSAHNNEPAIALYERAADALECSVDEVIALSDLYLRLELEAIALALGLEMLI